MCMWRGEGKNFLFWDEWSLFHPIFLGPSPNSAKEEFEIQIRTLFE